MQPLRKGDHLLTVTCDLKRKQVSMSAHGEHAIRYLLIFAVILVCLFKLLF